MERMETATLTWNGIEIETSCKFEYPIEGFCHIEVKSAERLPITETGYKSHFIRVAELEGFETYVVYVAHGWNTPRKAKTGSAISRVAARAISSIFERNLACRSA